MARLRDTAPRPAGARERLAPDIDALDGQTTTSYETGAAQAPVRRHQAIQEAYVVISGGDY